MKKLYNDQSGRSMIEMLGVLSIIGVLSVGGIAGYSKAMGKFNLSKATDQISQIVANVRTMYASQKDYSSLDSATAVNLGLIPSEMVRGSEIYNSYEGLVEVGANTDAVDADGINLAVGQGFVLSFAGLEREACTTLATQDWGSGTSSGLVAIAVSEDGAVADLSAPAVDDGSGVFVQPRANDATDSARLPVRPDEAADACSPTGNTVSFVYY